ncbi:MAG: hypothetical protein ACRCVT_06645 [Leadbetterella sp.]
MNSNKNETIVLSSNKLKVGVYFQGVLLLLLPIIFYFVIKGNSNPSLVGPILAILLSFVLAGFVAYNFMYYADAKIDNNKLILKKLFRPSIDFNFKEIQSVSSFRLKRTKYITVKMLHLDNSVEKFLILESNSILMPSKHDAERILLDLQHNSK